MALEGGTSVGTDADLGKARNVLRHFFCFRTRAALGRKVFAQADSQAFFRRNLASREDDLQRAALPDDARQPHGPSIDQRYPPASAIDAEIRFLRHHAKVAPQAQLHSACDCRSLDGGDDRFVQFETRRTQRSTWDFTVICRTTWPPEYRARRGGSRR